MQATVWSFDRDTHAGSVVLDDGQRVTFNASAFVASGLRFLRAGQRVRLEMDGDQISSITIITLSGPH
jgi:cold shock CspA family protein